MPGLTSPFESSIDGWLSPSYHPRASDAFGLMAISYEDPQRVARFNRKLEYPRLGIV